MKWYELGQLTSEEERNSISGHNDTSAHIKTFRYYPRHVDVMNLCPCPGNIAKRLHLGLYDNREVFDAQLL